MLLSGGRISTPLLGVMSMRPPYALFALPFIASLLIVACDDDNDGDENDNDGRAAASGSAGSAGRGSAGNAPGASEIKYGTPIESKYELDDASKLSLSIYPLGKPVEVDAEHNVFHEL